MISKEIENKYIKYKLEGWLDSKILYEEQDGKLTEKTIFESFKKKNGITSGEYEKIKSDNDEQIAKAKKYHNSKKNKEEYKFKDICQFYRWYIMQEKKCCYCGIEETNLEIYFNNNNLQYQDARQRGKILEIERVVTAIKKHNVYSGENCRLACYICNNAKSDFLSAKSFKLIAKGISEFWIEQGISIQFKEDDAIWDIDTIAK
jgi:hypothetical protein